MVESPFWSIDEVAENFQVPRQRIERLVHNKDIPAIKFGDKLWRIPKTAEPLLIQLIIGAEAVETVMNEADRVLIPSTEVAEYFGVGGGMITDYCRTGRIKAYKLGSRWGVPLVEIERITREGM